MSGVFSVNIERRMREKVADKITKAGEETRGALSSTHWVSGKVEPEVSRRPLQ